MKLISKEYVNAGYDLISFSCRSQVPDRFIEVKSLGYKEVFYWSKNEMAVAGFLQNRYYLYLVQFIDNEPLIWVIRNPYKHLNTLVFNMEPMQYRVQMDMSKLMEHVHGNLIQGFEYREVEIKDGAE